jgi:hypothetical protein
MLKKLLFCSLRFRRNLCEMIFFFGMEFFVFEIDIRCYLFGFEFKLRCCFVNSLHRSWTLRQFSPNFMVDFIEKHAVLKWTCQVFFNINSKIGNLIRVTDNSLSIYEKYSPFRYFYLCAVISFYLCEFVINHLANLQRKISLIEKILSNFQLLQTTVIQ